VNVPKNSNKTVALHILDGNGRSTIASFEHSKYHIKDWLRNTSNNGARTEPAEHPRCVGVW